MTVPVIRAIGAAVFATAMLASSPSARAQTSPPPPLPTGQFITPSAAPGAIFQNLLPGIEPFPNFAAGQAIRTVLSPDHRTLLVMTSGYNGIDNPDGSLNTTVSSEYIFVYDISAHTPVRKQLIQTADAFEGIAFSPDGSRFYLGGGGYDDVFTYANENGTWTQVGQPVQLNHAMAVGNGKYPTTAGLAVSPDGSRVVVANFYNDSVSLIDTASNTLLGERDMRPGIIDPSRSGVPGGETPFDVVIDGKTAYVDSQRDREVDVLDISGNVPSLITRIPIRGTPNRMLLDPSGRRVYVAADNDDSIQVIDTRRRKVVETIDVGVPAILSPTHERYRGVDPNALALSPDGRTLYVSEGGLNAIAVLAIGPNEPHVIHGYLPTGFYPEDVAVAGGWLYTVNGKSDSGPNLGYCPGLTQYFPGLPWVANCTVNQNVFTLEHAGFLAEPIPGRLEQLGLALQVAVNNSIIRRVDPDDAVVMAALHRRIRHVIYIIKENRTYDQVLGDLGRGNGDPALVEFGQSMTPNLHAIASNFVDLDNFEAPAEVSGNGWQFSVAARESDFNEKTVPLAYSPRPTDMVSEDEGQTLGVQIGVPTVAGRQAEDPAYPNDPNLLPTTNDEDAVDGPHDDDDDAAALATKQHGYLWNSALAAGLSVRSYGVYDDQNRYAPNPGAYGVADTQIPRDPNPFADGVPMGFPSNPVLTPINDVYFRGIDTGYPDYDRVQEWKREFDIDEAAGKLPDLTLLRLGADHTGSFSNAVQGVNTPETEEADNDYAVGLVAQAVAHSPDRGDTLIFSVEDDAQDGPDHVDSHRTTAYVLGPYVKQGAVISTRYSTINMLRTIEDILGIDHLSINDAYQPPMTDVFDLHQQNWTFDATPSDYLCSTQLPVTCSGAALHPTHSGFWWARHTRGMDVDHVDAADPVRFNEVLWRGLEGTRPYPFLRDGRDYGKVKQKSASRHVPRAGLG